MASHIELTDREREEIASLTSSRTNYLARGIVPYDPQAPDPLVVEAGALVERVLDAEGRSHIQHLLVPGDVIGLSRLPLTHHSVELQTTTPVVLSRLPRHRLRSSVQTRLGRLFGGLAAAEHVSDLARMRVVGCGRAEERIIHLFLELNGRQRRVVRGMGDRLWCPFPQSDLGAAVGLTNVYVSKMMSRLRDRGALRDGDGMIELRDKDWLAEEVGYEDPHDALDLAWIEEGHANVPERQASMHD